MATLAFAAAGAAVGSTLLPGGLTILGTTIAGATIGAQVGALAGSFVDKALFGPSGQDVTYEGPRLSDLRIMASSEGAPIPRLYGRARLGGQVIWASDIEEVANTETVDTGGGKGGGGGSSQSQTTYTYFANFAVAIAEGELSSLGRIWADGAELDLSSVTYRFYPGSETQEPDSLIVAREGAHNAPAYRGLAYVVFERLALEPFGNRLPQLSFEAFRAVDDLRERIRGVVLIPGTGEFVYSPFPVTRDGARAVRLAENVNTRQARTNWSASMDQLAATLPNARSASLIVSWFGTDLRAGSCQLRPGVERRHKDSRPLVWGVSGESRSTAHVVSTRNGRPAFGGTPSDQTVIAAIRDLKARGIAVTLTPFILMDIAPGNGRPDPHSQSGHQPSYPWRGRITVDPAPGIAGSPDTSPAAASQVAAFVGTAQVEHFALQDDFSPDNAFAGTVGGGLFGAPTPDSKRVVYSGPYEWSYRRFILHHAYLAKAAGGIDAFVIGSEMRALSQVRDSASGYPFVAALVRLAADVRRVLGQSTKVTYAADWSEYFGHQPTDGSGDVFFHLDPLWASDAIDAVGIDLYWPLADWRRGTGHRDAAEARSIYDLDYLKANITGGEGFDWFYASAADRDAQKRTTITDGAGKPWVFRSKDIKSWWQNRHYDRPGGVEQTQPTAWVPQSKPIWFMETGCPAVDKGANQPNVFFDPKSSESALPHYGEARRDDLMQRRYLQALIEAFDPDHPDHVAGLNPVSTVYGAPMIDLDRIHVYAWDARPFPAFPSDAETWGDAPNWRFGHWLNGRFAALPLNEAVAQIMTDFGFRDVGVDDLEGVLPGYVIDRIVAAREAIQPLELAFFFDAVESGGRIVLRHRGRGDAHVTLDADQLVETRPGAPLLTRLRAQETDLPATAKLRFVEAGGDYFGAVAEARKLAGASARVAEANLAMMLDHDQAAAIAEGWLHEAWAARETATFTLPPSRLAIEPGDLVQSIANGRRRLYRVTSVGDHGARDIEARSIDPQIYAPTAAAERAARPSPQPVVGTADALFLDLPLLTGSEPETDGYMALAQAPWPGDIAVFRSPEETGYVLAGVAQVPATTGQTLTVLAAGPEGRFDRATALRIGLSQGALTSVTPLQLFAGANVAAVRNASGAWEVLQFERADLVDTLTYDLSGLLRGQAGTECAMVRAGLAAGAPFVVLDGAVVRIALGPDQVALPYNWRYGPARRDIGHSDYGQATHAFAGLGRRPLSPVHVHATRQNGDVAIRWIRRTRIGGDSWEVDEVGLGEASERYEVDILDGDRVVRTLRSETPDVTYTAAAQVTDFGAVQPAVTCRIHQMSLTWGRGAPRLATI